MSAFLRGHHAAYDHPAIFRDEWARKLLSEEELAEFEATMEKALEAAVPDQAAAMPDRAAAVACMVRDYFPTSLFLSRAKYAEQMLEHAMTRGVKQYVILGAGMDTFLWRRADLADRLDVFEVDHPATQAFKQERLAGLGWRIPQNARFVAVDLTRQRLDQALRSAGFDSGAPSFVSWLGVIHYLPEDDAFATLRMIAGLCPEGSEIVFDYWDTEAFLPDRAAYRVRWMQELLRYAGEPMLTGLDPAAIAGQLRESGLHVQEQLSPEAIQERYFMNRSDGYYAYEHAYFVRAAVL
ncbi:class I SAM-dependent methyltransferase [Paenibacillus thiaminolyticus]|uniref:S-adenosyl-L-methionine-dependent methyltransferase n=1 Tax=Paenibacillus thiaminolyticus TaxID=49283 RepID=A0AAP9DZV5_PANTH|nr:class I SAM-dependent methyltransferase [Paenibacillus thiaminolyticus]MCY9538869.1 class I SAM-dependent methyltransferase [Paenibacillus thiaminolyticus]MCY9600456.1 class I SAM-dependent methyltransferase [Paenibacillus thiaminolyticus]MCY9606425.1 class I SAM-dependent methyltransferase [Paenibacillus thiaminolyticus]MCY9611913.1 class I SAM-dependent methyltransferase [Paenibacillus thiaminolyticus]MCY9621944.1 class I SAM-dependent methyltransferase [Paenibacillus thiaminolyticus]